MMKWLRKTLFVISPIQLIVTHMVLQVLDWATTVFIVSHTSTAAEANPLVRSILSVPYGMWWFAAVKLALCAMIAWIVSRSPLVWPWRAVAILYFAVVLSNLVGVAIVCMLP